MSKQQLSPQPKADRPIRCLIVQLARTGDTLQSLMALRAAKQLYPNLEITFVAHEQFAEPARRVSWLKQVITFPHQETLTSPRAEAIDRIKSWCKPLRKEPWDLMVNWTYSEASSYLSALIPARIRLGYTRRRNGAFLATDGWSHYLQAVVQGGLRQNIHLTDILTTQLLTALQIHFGEPVDAGNASVTSKSFFDLEIGPRDRALQWTDPTRRWIGIQLGNSGSSRDWPIASWTALAAHILKKHPETSIVFLGVEAAAPQVKAIIDGLLPKIRDSRRVLSLVGKTDFDLWASVVGRCQWLLSADTAAIHLASVLGTRILNLSVGDVRWWETGPYGNGHYVVTSALHCRACESRQADASEHECREHVSPLAAYAAYLYASQDWSHRRGQEVRQAFLDADAASDLPRVQVLRTRIRGGSEGGGVCFDPLLDKPLGLTPWMSMVLGHLARSWYCGWVPPVGQELKRSQITPPLIQKVRELSESVDILIRVCETARATSLELKSKSESLRSDRIMNLEDRNRLREMGSKLGELDTLIERLSNAQPALKAFHQMAQVLMHNLPGNKMTEIGEEGAHCYKQLGEGARILKDWIERTLSMAKPVALKKNVTPIQEIPQ